MADQNERGVAVTSAEELEAIIGTPEARTAHKERARLHAVDRAWLAAAPLAFVATSDEHGSLDVSPKGDPGGFAVVLDDTTIAIPERPGNRRADGFRNILRNPHVGLVFVIPGRGDTLRINGRATIVRDAPFLDRHGRARAPAEPSRSSSTSRRCSSTARRHSCAPRPGSPPRGRRMPHRGVP